jgi:hypothetical protein
MLRIIGIFVAAVTLAGCDPISAISTVANGLKQAKAVETELQESTGMKPQVGFNWHNGQLASVTVTYPSVPDNKTLNELSEVTRTAVVHQFKQTPNAIVLSFVLKDTKPSPTTKTPPDTDVQATH